MSEEGGFGFNLAEKFFGLIILVVGAIFLYYTLVSANVLLLFTDFFGFLSAVLIILGLVLIIAKTEE